MFVVVVVYFCCFVGGLFLLVCVLVMYCFRLCVLATSCLLCCFVRGVVLRVCLNLFFSLFCCICLSFVAIAFHVYFVFVCLPLRYLCVGRCCCPFLF